jgi:ABC-type sulfate transport system substrate-binding protein
MEQRFVVNGINNDKIELVSKYDVRKLNRLLNAKDKMWLVKIKRHEKKWTSWLVTKLDLYHSTNRLQ